MIDLLVLGFGTGREGEKKGKRFVLIKMSEVNIKKTNCRMWVRVSYGLGTTVILAEKPLHDQLRFY